MTLDQVTQFGIVHRPVREVGSQGQEDDERATWLGDGSQEQFDEASSLVFILGLRKEFLELIHKK